MHSLTATSSPARLRLTPLAGCLTLALSLAGGMPVALASDVGIGSASPASTHLSTSTTQDDPQRADNKTGLLPWSARNASLVQTTGSTLVVTNCDDSGVGSLRAAVDAAVSGDTVDMSQLTCSLITLSGPVLLPQDTLTLKGRAADSSSKYEQTPMIDGGASTTSPNNLGMIRHLGDGMLTIEHLALRNATKYTGGSTVKGGCVYSQGSVAMLASSTKYCTAQADSGNALGGAIYASDSVILENASISGSTATSDGGDAIGGGVYAGGTVYTKYSSITGNEATSVSGTSIAGGIFATGASIDSTTISGNSAARVGGLLVDGAYSVTIENSTISGNDSTGNDSGSAGAWLRTSNRILLENNTITENVNYTDTGAGLALFGNPSNVILTSNIISGNRYAIDTGSEVKYFPSDLKNAASTTISGSYNLVGAVDNSATLPVDTIRQVDTPLGPLQDNGGPTETHAIGTGSWAFNLGTTVDNGPFDAPESDDQRGEDRNVGAGVDIGAFESDALFLGRFEDPPTSL